LALAGITPLGDDAGMSTQPAVAGVQACETHLSQLFFTPDRVFKLLKPVALPFVDFSDIETRCAAATTEFERNQAISPDVYLGLADVVEDGVLTDRMIIMRRLRADQELTALLGRSDIADQLRDVAKHVATMHAGCPPLTDAQGNPAAPAAIAKNWNDNFAVTKTVSGTVIASDELAEVHRLATTYLAGRTELFNQRIAHGWVRDGHGDLRAEHIYCTDDGPRLIDCLAFDDELRVSDCLADVAFLGMDLDRLAGPNSAFALMASWNEFTNEHHPSSLAHFYVAYRAHVRCKIACLRYQAGDATAANEIRNYHRLAARHLRLAQIRVVLVGGGPGTGKSTVAAHVARHLGAAWLRTDEIRKDIAGIGHDCHDFAAPGQGIYSPQISDRTYAELIRQATMLVQRGVSVVLDATWSSAARRELLRTLATETSSEVTEIQTVLPAAIAKERIARRMASIHNPSDATPELVDYMAERFEAWPQAHTVDTRGPVEQTLRATLELFSVPAEPSEKVQQRFSVNLAMVRDTMLVSAGLEGSLHV